VRGRLRELGLNAFEDTFDISKNLVVPETQHLVSALYQPLIARSIAIAQRVLTAINFNHEPPLAADEVNNIRPDRMLPNKFATIERARAELVPKFDLRFGREVSQPTTFNLQAARATHW
jgi:hypothetical protein